MTQNESPMMKAASKREQSGAGSGYAEHEQARSMSKQWRDLKAKHPDALLLFRCGDFYEAYGDDAKVCAKELGITLTYSNTDKTPMAGFPYHALDSYLPRLIRNGHRIAICDQLDPPPGPRVKRGSTETINNNSSTNQISEDEVMTNNTMKAGLTVGTVIEIVGTTGKYVIKAIEGDKLTVDFYRKEGEAPTTMPMPKAMLQKMMEAGKWKVQSVKVEGTEYTVKDDKGEDVTFESHIPGSMSEDDVQEVEDVQPEPAKTIKMEQPAKPKVTLKRKSQPKAEKKPETKAKAKGLTYSTYTNKKGKTCAKISGFAEGDAILERAAAESIHASSTYERDAKGNKRYMLIFGPRYAAAAKEVCQAMNEGKDITALQAIINQATEERQAKQKQNGGYSDQQVAEMITAFLKGGTLPEGVMKRIPQEVIDMAIAA